MSIEVNGIEISVGDPVCIAPMHGGASAVGCGKVTDISRDTVEVKLDDGSSITIDQNLERHLVPVEPTLRFIWRFQDYIKKGADRNKLIECIHENVGFKKESDLASLGDDLIELHFWLCLRGLDFINPNPGGWVELLETLNPPKDQCIDKDKGVEAYFAMIALALQFTFVDVELAAIRHYNKTLQEEKGMCKCEKE